jgi:hypothetical protein
VRGPPIFFPKRTTRRAYYVIPVLLPAGGSGRRWRLRIARWIRGGFDPLDWPDSVPGEASWNRMRCRRHRGEIPWLLLSAQLFRNGKDLAASFYQIWRNLLARFFVWFVGAIKFRRGELKRI